MLAVRPKSERKNVTIYCSGHFINLGYFLLGAF